MLPALFTALGLCVLFVFNVSKPGASVEGVYNREPVPQNPFAPNLGVLSLNFFHDFPNEKFLNERTTLLTLRLKENEADIICLQEAPWTRELNYAAAHIADVLGFNYAFVRANGNKSLLYFEEGVAILSRYPIEKTAHTVLDPKAGFFENRVAVYAEIITPHGKMGVVSTHITGNEKTQLGQIENLVAFVDAQAGDLPAIICGDFNFEHGSPAYSLLARHWIDTYYMLNPDKEGNTCCIGDLSAKDGREFTKRVDFIFQRNGKVGRAFTANSAKLHFEQAEDVGSQFLRISDHSGIFTAFTF